MIWLRDSPFFKTSYNLSCITLDCCSARMVLEHGLPGTRTVCSLLCNIQLWAICKCILMCEILSPNRFWMSVVFCWAQILWGKLHKIPEFEDWPLGLNVQDFELGTYHEVVTRRWIPKYTYMVSVILTFCFSQRCVWTFWGQQQYCRGQMQVCRGILGIRLPLLCLELWEDVGANFF